MDSSFPHFSVLKSSTNENKEMRKEQSHEKRALTTSRNSREQLQTDKAMTNGNFVLEN